jgi:hypothetical protein
VKIRREGRFVLGGIIGLPYTFAGILVGQRIGRRLLYRGTVEWGLGMRPAQEMVRRGRKRSTSPFHDFRLSRGVTWLDRRSTSSSRIANSWKADCEIPCTADSRDCWSRRSIGRSAAIDRSLLWRHHPEPETAAGILSEGDAMRMLTVVLLAAVILLSSYQAEAAAKNVSLVSPALTSNISGTDSVQCLISNLSSSTVEVNIVLFNGGGDSFPSVYNIPANGTDGPIAFFETNYYSRCVATPTNASNLPLLRGSHCVIDANRTAKACVEVR